MTASVRADAEAQGAPGIPAVAYVIRMFPQLSETFIVNEVRALEKAGVAIQIYSYRRPTSPVTHECVRRVRASITYLPDPLYRHPLALVGASKRLYGLDGPGCRRTVGQLVRETFDVREPYAWRRFLHAIALADHLKRTPTTHIHAHMAHSATRVAMLAAMLTGLPFSFTAHARDLYTADPAVLVRKVQAAEFVLTCTRAGQRYLQGLLAADQRDKVHLVYHGIDLNTFVPREEKQIDETPLILAVGRLVEKKGFDCLLRACRILKDGGTEFRCRIVGDGPEKAALQDATSRLGLGELVEISRGCSQEDLLDHYKAAAVFALPCQVLDNGDRDGIPNVLVEAMAVGIPVVSTKVSGIPEIIHDGRTGLLVEPRDPAALASALARLIQSPTLKARIARDACKAVHDEFDSWANGVRLAEFFRSEAAARENGVPRAEHRERCEQAADAKRRGR